MFDRIISAKIEMSEDECYNGIQEFYDKVAEKFGFDSNAVLYDCTKICVTNAVQEKIFDYYINEKHLPNQEIGKNWLIYGPKANLPGDAFIVEVMNGFIQEA